MCRAAAEAAAQSELGQCPDLRAKRKATTVPRRSRHTGLSGRGWSHAPGGSVCRAAAEAAARSRSSKRACDTGRVPTSSCLRLVEGGTARRGGRAACLASSLRPRCSPHELLLRWPAPFKGLSRIEHQKNRPDVWRWRAVPCRVPHCFFRVPAGKKLRRVDRVTYR